MRTAVTEMFGLEVPLFAFSHCRDVVLEVSKAGGMGVLGAAWMTPEELEVALAWIDARVEGKPYAVDIVFPGTYASLDDTRDAEAILPSAHRQFVDKLLQDANIPDMPEADARQFAQEHADKMRMTPQDSEQSLAVALRHPQVKLIVSAMGAAPRRVVETIHQHGLKVGALVGNLDHARKQKDAGVDVLIAQGTEAGGHTGRISSMVLWPQLVDAMAPIPVLAAGGIGRGRQFAAAMALGCAGAWCGSIWLGTRESELSPEMKAALFAAKSEDAVISKALTGKTCRLLRSRYTDAWDQAQDISPLTFPLQSILGGLPLHRAERVRRMDYWTYAVGQIVGDMKEETSVRQVVTDMLGEYAETMESLNQMLE